MAYESQGTDDASQIVLEVDTPLGVPVRLDKKTHDLKVAKHGRPWAGLDQCRILFSDPELITESQHAGMETSLMFFRKAEVTTPAVKYVRGIADFRTGEAGIIRSVHPRRDIGNTGQQVYPVVEETTEDGE